MTLRQLVSTVELMVVSAVATFLGAISFTAGGFDLSHLKAAAIGAGTALVYRVSGVLSIYANPLPTPAEPKPAAAPVAPTLDPPPPPPPVAPPH